MLWTDDKLAEAFTDPTTGEPYPVPDDIREAATAVVRAYNIRGICDPMWIANAIALRLGRGDGRHAFDDDHRDRVRRVAAAMDRFRTPIPGASVTAADLPPVDVDDPGSAAMAEALERGWVKRWSVTQAHWTEEGAEVYRKTFPRGIRQDDDAGGTPTGPLAGVSVDYYSDTEGHGVFITILPRGAEPVPLRAPYASANLRSDLYNAAHDAIRLARSFGASVVAVTRGSREGAPIGAVDVPLNGGGEHATCEAIADAGARIGR